MKIKQLLDINGDGKINRKDAVAAAKVVGAAALGVAFTVSSSAAAGSAVVATGAAAIAKATATTIGITGGAVLGMTIGKATVAITTLTEVGGLLIVESAIASTVSQTVVAKATACGGAAGLLMEATTGAIAGLPIVKAMALSSAVSSGEVVVLGGVAYSISAAISAGLIAAIVVAGVVYYVAIKPRKG